MELSNILAEEFDLKEEYSINLINLLDEGCTIPFISRYRKEMHGTCDDQTIRAFSDRLNYLRNLEKRKEEILKLISDQEKLTPEIEEKIKKSTTQTALEDIYRPFRPKRQTRATIAISKGLDKLAEIILRQKETEGDILKICEPFVSEEKEVKTSEEALQGALDIIAENISDNADIRKDLREFLFKSSFIVTTLKPNEKVDTYLMYDNYKEQVCKMPSHRVLAINRGEKEDCIKAELEVNVEKCLEIIKRNFKIKESIFAEVLNETVLDSFKRLILPSLEREIRNQMFDDASEQAIKMFEVNLKPLLMQPPLKHNVILGLDPAYRTGCKLAVIDENGMVLDTGVIYHHTTKLKRQKK